MDSNSQNRKNGNRSDIGWEHGMEVDNNPRKIECRYCKKIISGNIYRFKHHLACTKKDVEACKSVPGDVKKQMVEVLAQSMKSSKRKMMNDEEEEMVEIVPHKKGKKLRDEACRQIARFFHTSAIPFSCAKNPEFAKIFELVEKCGSEFVPPSYHELENSSLEKDMTTTTDMLEEYRYEWEKTGCSIICNKWTDTKGRFYINFLVNNPTGTIFLKSIDASDFSTTIEKVFEVLDEIVEKVGEENVVQVITNNSTSYKAATKMLLEKRKKIVWSPCVIQLLDEILEDIEKNLLLHWITIAKGKKISAFIYSSTITISMLRDFTNGKDLNGPTTAPSANAYLTLLYLIDMKDELIGMFSSTVWKIEELSKTKEGIEIQQIVQDCGFWNDIVDCLNFALPIIEVLLRIDSYEKPTMGFIFEEMMRAKESCESLNNANWHETIWKIIKERWNTLLGPLYAASYFLNPQLKRDGPSFKFPDDYTKEGCAYIVRMVIDCHDSFKKTEENVLKIEHQLKDFSTSEGLFGSQAAILTRHTKDPAEWWDSYGKDCPELQRIAIRLLSLTCSSCGGAQIQNAYEQVYPKKRSSLYQKKLNDLFFVIQNFKSNTQRARTKTFELTDLEVLSLDHEWITEKEVGEVSGAKKDMLVDDGVDEDVSEGVPLSGNCSGGHEVDTCLNDRQPQGIASGTLEQVSYPSRFLAEQMKKHINDSYMMAVNLQLRQNSPSSSS